MKQTRGYLLLICIVSAMGGLLFGYDWVVIGGAKIFYEPFFGIENSAALRGWAMSSALIGCLAGALLSGIWSDKYGQKKMLVIASFLFALSAWGAGSSRSFFLLHLLSHCGRIGHRHRIQHFSRIYCRGISCPCTRQIRIAQPAHHRIRYFIGIIVGQLANQGILHTRFRYTQRNKCAMGLAMDVLGRTDPGRNFSSCYRSSSPKVPVGWLPSINRRKHKRH